MCRNWGGDGSVASSGREHREQGEAVGNKESSHS